MDRYAKQDKEKCDRAKAAAKGEVYKPPGSEDNKKGGDADILAEADDTDEVDRLFDRYAKTDGDKAYKNHQLGLFGSNASSIPADAFKAHKRIPAETASNLI